MDPWTSDAIPTPLDPGNGFVPSIADPDGPAATQAFIAKAQHIIDYTYQKSPLIGRNAASAQAMADLTYQKSSLIGRRGASAQTMVTQTYHKSSLIGRSGASLQAMVDSTYHKASLIGGSNVAGEGSPVVGRAMPYAQILKSVYHSPPNRSVSGRMALQRKVDQSYNQNSLNIPGRTKLARMVSQSYHKQSGGGNTPTQILINMSRSISTHYRPAPAGATRISMIPRTGYYLVS